MTDELKTKILAMTDKELMELVYKKPDDYTDEVKKIANDEIEKRGIIYSDRFLLSLLAEWIPFPIAIHLEWAYRYPIPGS